MTRQARTVREEPFFAENGRGQRLLMWIHEAAGSTPKTGIVFCHPLHEEKQCCHRPYVKMARAFAARGVPSVRFDAFGFGDSEGDLIEATIESQVADTGDAIDQLREETGVTSVCLIGTRLGGTIAALAARHHPAVMAVTLVSPILSGAAYWDELVSTSRMASLAMGEKPPSRDELEAQVSAAGHFEMSGQRLGTAFVRELRPLDVSEILEEWNGHVFLAGLEKEMESLEALGGSLRSLASPVELTPIERDFWTYRAMFDMYAPDELTERVGTWIEGLS